MGNVNFGAPRDIIKKLQATFKINTLVETGTYMGGTAAWGSEHFERVFTIEGLPNFHHQAKKRYGHLKNIEFLLGDSRSILSDVVARIGNTPTLFWLDAHWMPGSFGDTHECPLLEEIGAIYQNKVEHFILIDDARLFLAPPPLPHRAKDWPDIAAVLSVLNRFGHTPNYTVIYNDVIISIPSFAKKTMQEYYQEKITASFQSQVQQDPNLLFRFLGRIKHRLSKVPGI